LAETPQLPPPRIWTPICGALLVSKDRRHLFVTPCGLAFYREGHIYRQSLVDLNFILFGILKGFKRRIIAFGITISFFLQNVLNVPFFASLHSKFAKSAHMTPPLKKKLFSSELVWGIKNGKFLIPHINFDEKKLFWVFLHLMLKF
jgi:hypothetical protein